jgi:type IV secretion system protein VirB10
MSGELKNPFGQEPPPQPHLPPGDNAPSPGLTKGKVRRNLHIVALLVAALAVVGWMFWPDNHRQVTQAEPITKADLPETDAAGKQLLRVLQADASAPAAKPAGAAAGTGGGTAIDDAPPKPVTVGAASSTVGPRSDDRFDGLARGPSREEEVWGSAISSAGVTLRTAARADNAAGRAVTAAGGDAQADGDVTAGTNPIDTVAGRQLAMLSQLGQPQQSPTGKAADSAFMTQAAADSPNLTNRHQPGYGQAAIYQGTVIRSVLLSGLNSDLPCTVTQRVPLIPVGSKLVGICRNEVAVGQTRVLVALQRLILPNGTWIPLSGASGNDMQGMGGLEADVNNHFLKIFGSSLVIGAASLLASTSSQNVTVNVGAGGTQQGGTVFAQTLSETVRAILQRNLNIQPTLTVEPGAEFLFVVSRDTLMSPWSAEK